MLRGRTLVLAGLLLTAGLGYTALPGISSADDPHAPIRINNDSEFAACSCVRSGSGTAADPLVISDWRIDHLTSPAISIRNVQNTHFIVRENTLNARTGVVLENTGDRGQVIANDITHRKIGVDLENSSPRVVDNTIRGPKNVYYTPGTDGIRVDGGNPLIQANLVTQAERGISATSSSAHILENEIVQNYDGVHLSESASARLEDNTIRLSEHWGLVVERSAKAELIGNEIREGQGGVVVKSATLYMEGNTVFNQRGEAVRFTDAVVTLFRNEISDNWRGAWGSTDSDVIIVENEFVNNQDTGIRVTRSEGRIEGNLLELNGIGIELENTSIKVVDNEMNNNTFGLSLPYGSRLTINQMSGNYVNGINVDGTEVPQDKRIFYKASGLTISGKLIDGGHNEGFFGSTIKQGALLIYDSIDITIEDNVFAFNQRGILVVDSTFVTIQNNTFTNNQEGVVSVDSRVFIKENECDIDIDPPGTSCVIARGGFVAVRANIIANVDIGIHFDTTIHHEPSGVIEGNAVFNTRVGIQAEGHIGQSKHAVRVDDNEAHHNQIGIKLVGFRATLTGNKVTNNTHVGIELTSRTNATFHANVVLHNQVGVKDTDHCAWNMRHRCSTGVFADNRIKANAKTGISLNNGGSFEGDLISRNKVGTDIQGTTTFRDVNVTANKGVGARVHGSTTILGGNFSANGDTGFKGQGNVFARWMNAQENGEDGLEVRGWLEFRAGVASNNTGAGLEVNGSAHVAHSAFEFNGRAGLDFNGTIFTVVDCDVRFNLHGILFAEALVEVEINPELPRPEIPDIPDLPNLPSFPPDRDDDQDPLFMEECDIVKNERFALRASVETVIKADQNYWGPDGPVFEPPLIRGSNTIHAVGLFSPYWADENHTEPALLPSTTLMPGQTVSEDPAVTGPNTTAPEPQAKGNESAGPIG